MHRNLKEAGLRATCDMSNEKIGAKIAKAHAEKLPCMLVVGPEESHSGSVNVRIRGQKASKSFTVDQFLAMINKAVDNKNTNLVC